MIELNIKIAGMDRAIKMLDAAADLPMTQILTAAGGEAVERIRDRTLSGKTLDGQRMPPSVRAIKQGGITLYDTRQMLGQSMGVKKVDKTEARIAFDADRATIAHAHQYSKKHPRPFFGFGAGDKNAITEAAREEFDAYIKEHGGT
jgi:hypothetical protein